MLQLKYFLIKIIVSSKFRNSMGSLQIQHWYNTCDKTSTYSECITLSIFITSKHWWRSQVLWMKLNSPVFRLSENKNAWTHEESIVCSECAAICWKSSQSSFCQAYLLLCHTNDK